MPKRKRKCVARGQRMHFCDGCKTNSTKCPYRDKYRDLRRTKKGAALCGSTNEIIEEGENDYF